MKISKSDESSLLIALTEALQKANVTYYGYISLPAEWEDGVKSSLDEDFSRRLYSQLDDGGLESLIQREVFDEFISNKLDLPPHNEYKKLTNYKPFSDALAVARRLTGVVAQAPYQYELVARAANGFTKILAAGVSDIKISDRLRLVSGSALKGRFATTSGFDAVDDRLRAWNARDSSLRNLEDSALYFTYRTSGYASDRSKPKCFAEFGDDMRAFYGACISFGILNSYSSVETRCPVAIIGNKVVNNVGVYTYVEVADNDIVNACGLTLSKNTIADLQGDAGDLAKVLEGIVKLFNCDESQRLRTASIWLLRAYLSSLGMDQILDSTIAIEVLLGDREASDRVGLSKLMANRCAYSLGKSAGERKKLFDFFMQFYRVRSDIVHSGRLKLSETEAEVVSEGTKLASRILRHETDIS